MDSRVYQNSYHMPLTDAVQAAEPLWHLLIRSVDRRFCIVLGALQYDITVRSLVAETVIVSGTTEQRNKAKKPTYQRNVCAAVGEHRTHDPGLRKDVIIHFEM